MSEDFNLYDGGPVGYVINYQPIRYKCYSPKSQQYKQGVYGRHQVMNEFGWWDNAYWLDKNKCLIVKDKPDAKLIAAAPELLEALETCAKRLRAYADADTMAGLDGVGTFAEPDRFVCKALIAAENAIAKAKS